jgi:hypothetical protein
MRRTFVKISLGARRSHVLRIVLAHAGILICAGLAIGMAGGLGVGRVMASNLFEGSPPIL